MAHVYDDQSAGDRALASKINALAVANGRKANTGLFPESAAEYIVFPQGGLYHHRNGHTGEVSTGDTSAAATMQDALDAVASTGGSVFVKRWNYPITAKISMPNTVGVGEDKHIQFIGDNATLSGDATLADNILELDAVTTNVNYSYRISGFHIYPAKKDSTYYNIYIKDPLNVYLDHLTLGWNGLKIEDASIVYLDNIYFVDSYNQGLLLDNTSYVFGNNLFLDNCGGYGSGAYDSMLIQNGCSKIYLNNFNILGEKGVLGGQKKGIYISGSGKLHFNNFIIEGHKESSITISDGDDITFSNFVLDGSDTYGIEMSPTDNITDILINNFKISSGTEGIALYAQNTKYIKRIIISNGILYDIAGGKGVHISDDSSGGAICTYVNVHDVTFDTFTNGIEEANASDYNTFKNNIFISCTTPISAVGANTVTKLNLGYVTENGGTGTIDDGSTSDVIAHGLDYTPSAKDIVITLTENPDNTPGAIWVDTIGAANFTVNCENNPGASNLDFSWSIRRI